ncbi:ribonuclease HI family protein [Candidatus Wolfebacteria bacterium]|nr:ribonuclease HI family protein [Candidatus Wolfebacteria bacterium]
MYLKLKLFLMKNLNKILIFTDGGSRGNPGPSAIGVVFTDDNGRVLKEYSRHLGKATNNQAEYEAVVFALEKAKLLKYKNIELRIDSELIGRQLLGKYKIKDPDLQPLFLKVWNLRIDFDNVDIKIIPREQNREADKLVNRELDDKSRLF